MSTNKTEHFDLHSWVPDDELHLSEINENFAKLDSSVPQEMEKVKQALTKEIQELDGRKPQILTGSYVGNERVELGVKPLAVIVMIARGNMTNSYAWCGIATQDMPLGKAMILDESGFTPGWDDNYRVHLYYESYAFRYVVFY